MQQDPASTSPVAAAATSAPAADPAAMPGAGFAGDSDADALSQMGFANLWHEMTSDPGEFMVSWVVLLTLILMSVGSWYYTVVNLLKNSVIRARADRVISTFWETPNPQDAIRFMEEQPKGEPFSKIALDAAQAAAHHSKPRRQPPGRSPEPLRVHRPRPAPGRDPRKRQARERPDLARHGRFDRSVRRPARHGVGHLRRADQDRRLRPGLDLAWPVRWVKR
jgi:hypothetical protein